ncbi:MAG: alpha/beta hydrolase [Desulfobulbaceae bacterium]
MSLGTTRRTCRVEGHSLAYYRQGGGEVLLLVHGITTYSFIWRRVFPILAGSFDTIAVDLLGCGESDKPLDVSYGLRAHADRLVVLARELGIDRFHLVGHDLGGGIGQLLAVHHPGLLRSLVLVNTVGYDYWPVQPVSAIRAPVIREILMAAVDLGVFRYIVRRGMHHPDRVNPELMELFMKPLRTGAGRKALMHFARCLDNRELTAITEDLRRLDLPVLVIRGEEDVYLSRIISERLAGEIPSARLMTVPAAGHFIQEDEPETLGAAIRDFCGRIP